MKLFLRESLASRRNAGGETVYAETSGETKSANFDPVDFHPPCAWEKNYCEEKPSLLHIHSDEVLSMKS